MDFTLTILGFILFVNTVGAIITVFKDTREIAATWAWLLVLVFLPVIGFILYSFFGKKISKSKIYNLQSQESLGIKALADSQLQLLEQNTDSLLAPNEYAKELAILFLENDESLMTHGNEVELFINGTHLFESILQDIKNARHHIHLLYYIFKDDELGIRVMNALVDRAKEGVEVLVVYDAMGSRSTSHHFWKELEKYGGKAVPFFGQSIGFVNIRMNYRNHRKIIVIDGKIGYIGGFNIGNEYINQGKFGYWRDSHLRILGNAVSTLQSRFFMDWNAVAPHSFEKAYSLDYFPEASMVGMVSMQVVSTGPDNDFQKIKMGLLKMIGMAKHHIYLQTPYFIPDESLFEALMIAAMSGVQVHIMIPNRPDHPFVYRATEYYAREILQYGAHIYLYEDGFLHAKTMTVDGKVGTIGTHNFDVRSFKLNFETNAFLYSQEKVEEMERIFVEDMKQCTKVTQEYFAQQSRWKKFKQDFSRLFSPIL